VRRSKVRELLCHLGDRVFKPIDALLEECATVTLVLLSGGFDGLPLHALSWRRQPLCFQRDCIYADSLAAALDVKPWRGHLSSCSGEAVVVANPLPTRMEPLPCASVEGHLLEKMLPNTILLAEKSATLEAVHKALPRARVFHAATHCCIHNDAPLESEILLSNGTLYCDTVVGLTDRCSMELAVFNCCQTGVSRALGGTVNVFEALGTRSWGASAAITALWNVVDESSLLIMARFYRLVVEEEVHPARAMRLATRHTALLSKGDSTEELEALSQCFMGTSLANIIHNIIIRGREEKEVEHPPCGARSAVEVSDVADDDIEQFWRTVRSPAYWAAHCVHCRPYGSH